MKIKTALLALGFSLRPRYTPPGGRGHLELRHSLAAIESGAPALNAINPLGQNGFATDTVFGNSQTVYRFSGNTTPTEQAGLAVNTTGLLTQGNAYSVDMIFKFNADNGSWKEISGFKPHQRQLVLCRAGQSPANLPGRWWAESVQLQ